MARNKARYALIAFLAIGIPSLSGVTGRWPMRFADQGIEQAVRASLKAPTRPIWIYEIGEIDQLVAGDPVTSVSDLRHARQLKILKLDNPMNEISDFHAIVTLPLLNEFELTNAAPIADPRQTHLQQASALEYLVLDWPALVDLSFLETMPQLKFLSISGNTGITDLSPLKHLPRLQTVELYRLPNISSFQPLVDLVAAREAKVPLFLGLDSTDWALYRQSPDRATELQELVRLGIQGPLD